MVSYNYFYFKQTLKQNKSKYFTAKFFLLIFTGDSYRSNKCPHEQIYLLRHRRCMNSCNLCLLSPWHGQQHRQIWKSCYLCCLFHCGMINVMNKYGNASEFFGYFCSCLCMANDKKVMWATCQCGVHSGLPQ